MKFATHKFDDVIRYQRRYGSDATETVTPAPGTDAVTTTSSSILTPTSGTSSASETVSTAPPPVLPPPPQKTTVDSSQIAPRPAPATINVIVPPTFSTNLPNTPLGFNDVGARSSGSGSGAGVESPAEKAVSSAKNSGKNVWWLLFLAVAGTGVYIYNK